MWLLSLIAMPIVIGLSFYLYRFLKRIFETCGADVGVKKIKIIIYVLTVLGLFGMAYITGIVALFMLHVLGFAAVVQLINYFIKKIAKEKYEVRMAVWKKIYGCGVIPIVLAIGVITYGYFNLYHIVETNYTIYTDKEIREEGYRVALIADVHYGVSLNREELLAECEEISKREVDIVILCGDIVDESTTKKQMEEVFQAFGEIDNQFGVFYVYGNHDRPMRFVDSSYTQEELVNAIEENGITILQDCIYEINEEFTIVGRDDRTVENRASVEDLFGNVSQETFILTLDHQPNEYEENGKIGTDLLLSGHTHGGQIFPLNWIQEIFKINDAVYGHTQIDKDTQAIVTSGFAGWSYPIKTSAPAEYVIIDIKER